MLSEVITPEKIRVHIGPPSTSGDVVTVGFPEYIKNVASSEIYATWPEAALEANILAQISYALNRVYTEWYPSRGYAFDITTSTAYDQCFVYGRNIFQEISTAADRVLKSYVRRKGHKEPYFTAYCNGTSSKCQGLSQWGTMALALGGMGAFQILKRYYPEDIEIVKCNTIAPIVPSYSGVLLKEGTSGDSVARMQKYLNRVREDWPSIPQIKKADGIFGPETAAAAKAFQKSFNLAADGLIGKETWYKISAVYAAVKKLAALDSEGEYIGAGSPPGSMIREGDKNGHVAHLQFLLNHIGLFFPEIVAVIENARFDMETKASVTAFQKRFGLKADGVAGPATWAKLLYVYDNECGRRDA